MSTEHALLSASSAHRWLECPPSAKLEAELPDKSSVAAAEGTLAHAIAENRLLQAITGASRFVTPKWLVKDPLYHPSMDAYVDEFVYYCMEQKSTHELATIYREQRVNYSGFVPGGFGTADCVIIGDGIVDVIDFKYGKGVPVDAKDNPQLRLYALGVADTFPLADIDLVRMHIVQPRLDSITVEEKRLNELINWAIEYVQPRAILAAKGEGEFKAGPHCQFCKVAATCRARAERQLELARYEFKSADLLTNEEIGDILARVDDLTHWAKDVKEWALREAIRSAEKFPGWKLVLGRSNRTITDKDEAMARLIDAGASLSDILELVTLTKLEERLGRHTVSEALGTLIDKPQGKPTLVRETDRRPEWTGTDFDEEIE